MIEVLNCPYGAYLVDGKFILPNKKEGLEEGEITAFLQNKGADDVRPAEFAPQTARQNTMSYAILRQHDQGGTDRFQIRFDALASHDITYVGIIQTARAAGLDRFPVPYVLTNCHNSLCAVGGTINEDDHLFGLSAVKRYGGIYVPAHLAVIHQYVREVLAAPGKMILGSDSHTRYGFLGAMGFGEGGPELVKQLLGHTYALTPPPVAAVYLEGEPRPGVGPQDVALALIAAVFPQEVVKNKILEFVGPGVSGLSADFRAGIDVMTTETACLSSVWQTDERIEEYLAIHGREDQYNKLQPGDVAYYDAVIRVDLSRIQPMIALPFHPSTAVPIAEVNRRPADFLAEVEKRAVEQLGEKGPRLELGDKIVDGRLRVDQAVVAGCSGGLYENLCDVAALLGTDGIGDPAFPLSLYPASQALTARLVDTGIAGKLMRAGAVMRTAFCGPCFGAGDVPANNCLSIRHTTRNFPHREGSKPAEGQVAAVALMDARSIAATAANGGLLTEATELADRLGSPPSYFFDGQIYKKRVYDGFGHADQTVHLRFGPNIKDWPAMPPMPEALCLRLCAVIRDPVTTTDELIPSGETSSFRSNPCRLAEFTLSRRCPDYVSCAKKAQKVEKLRAKYIERTGDPAGVEELKAFLGPVQAMLGGKPDSLRELLRDMAIGSAIYANRPGDGSAREQAASCQKVLGGWANVALDYATRRYRSNVVNWGMLPFVVDEETAKLFEAGDLLYISKVRSALESGAESLEGTLLGSGKPRQVVLKLLGLSEEERGILIAGGLVNYLRQSK